MAAGEVQGLWQQLSTPAGRSAWWRKHRRTVLIGAGVVGVGVAGYWYWAQRCEWLERQEVVRLQREAELRRRNEQLQRICQEEEAARADAQLQTHFESIQLIADSTTLPSVLPHLKMRLLALIDLSSLTEALVASRASGAQPGRPHLSNQEKMRIWEDLKILSFTRALGSMWAVGLLFLFVRIQLNILGRHVYIHTAAEDSSSPSSSHPQIQQQQPQDKPQEQQQQEREQLSMSCQHKFIAFSDYLPHCGLPTLLKDVQESMTQALHLRSLKDKFNPEQLTTLLLDLRAEFEASHSSRWHQYLLPAQNVLPDDLAVASSAADVAQSGSPGVPHGQQGAEEADDDHAVSMRSGALASAMAGAYHRASREGLAEESSAAAPTEEPTAAKAADVESRGRAGDWSSAEGAASGESSGDAALEGLMTETRQVLSSPQFREALKATLDSISRTALDELAVSAFFSAPGGAQAKEPGVAKAVPLAKLLPPVASIAASLLDLEDNRHLASLASVPEISVFSARVYAGTVTRPGMP